MLVVRFREVYTVPFATKVKGSNLQPHKKSQFLYIGSPMFGMLSKGILLKLKKKSHRLVSPLQLDCVEFSGENLKNLWCQF